jgi:hypothetical protein
VDPEGVSVEDGSSVRSSSDDAMTLRSRICAWSSRVEHVATEYESADIPGRTPLFEYARGGLASTLCTYVFSNLPVRYEPDDVLNVPGFECALNNSLVLAELDEGCGQYRA